MEGAKVKSNLLHRQKLHMAVPVSSTQNPRNKEMREINLLKLGVSCDKHFVSSNFQDILDRLRNSQLGNISVEKNDVGKRSIVLPGSHLAANHGIFWQGLQLE